MLLLKPPDAGMQSTGVANQVNSLSSLSLMLLVSRTVLNKSFWPCIVVTHNVFFRKFPDRDYGRTVGRTTAKLVGLVVVRQKDW